MDKQRNYKNVSLLESLLNKFELMEANAENLSAEDIRENI